MAQSLLANGGLRSRILGSSASLAIAAPIADTDPSMGAHTAANRTGLWFSQTLNSESIGVVIGGLAGLSWTHNQSGVDQTLTGRISQTGVSYLLLTGGVEVNDVSFNNNQTKQFMTTVPTTQRSVWIQAPTYSCDTPGQTITTAATLAIAAAPTAGSNCAITTPLALWVQSGNALFAGSVSMGGQIINQAVGAVGLTINGNTQISSEPTISVNQTWNNAAVNFTGFLANYTITADAGASLLFDFQIAGSSKLNCDEFGSITSQGNLNAGNGRTQVIGAGEFIINSNTITTNAPMVSLTQTWNNAATTFTGIVQYITNTASNAASLLMDLQVGGSSKFNISVSGLATSVGLTSSGNITANGTSGVGISPAAAAGGTRQALTITPAANVSITSGVESPSVIFNSATRQWATSTPTTQREWQINGPTYACDTAGQTITTAATFSIAGPPVAGTHVTITTPLALWVQAGNVLFAGTTSAGSSITGALVIGNGTASTSVGIGAGNLQVGSSATVTVNVFAGTQFICFTGQNANSSTVTTSIYRISGGGTAPFATANGLVYQTGGTTTAGSGHYFYINNATTNILSAIIGGANPAANSFGGSLIYGRNNAAADTAGVIGETITSTVSAQAAPGTTTTGNVTSVSLTAGKWVISGFMVVSAGATGLTVNTTIQMSVGVATGATGTNGLNMAQESVLALLANGLFTIAIPAYEVNITATTSEFMTASMTYAAGSPTIAATIKAVRVG
jgi:hypothetical protein